MNQKDKANINRLIQTGEASNLSLAYHLMVGLGVDEAEAVWHMMYNFHNPLRFNHIVFTLDFVHFATFSIWPCKGGLICGSPITLWSCTENDRWTDLRRILTKTRHIWQDKI